MDNISKAIFLYKKAEAMEEAGNTLASQNLEKLADHFGSLYVKEALAYSKKKRVKKAVIEKPKRAEMSHPSKTTKEANLANIGQRIMNFGSKWNQAQGVVPKTINTVLAGAGYAALPLGAAAYFGPDMVKQMAKDTAEESTKGFTDGLMDKVKEYAVPAALLLAGGGTLAYSSMKGSGTSPADNRQRHFGATPNARGQFQNIGQRRSPAPAMGFPTRRKMANVIQGVKYREKLSSCFGESSKEVDLCDKAISRILFKE